MGKKSNQDRNTPEEVLDPVRQFFGGRIPLDPCPNQWSTVNPRHECKDGLTEPWKWDAFVNNPWDDSLVWAHKGLLERARHRIEELFWLPCYPETGYSRLLYGHASRVCFWGKRVDHPVHGKPGSGSMWPTQLIYLGSKVKRFEAIFSEHGTCFAPVRP
jgi:hypothetical protein